MEHHNKNNLIKTQREVPDCFQDMQDNSYQS